MSTIYFFEAMNGFIFNYFQNQKYRDFLSTDDQIRIKNYWARRSKSMKVYSNELATLTLVDNGSLNFIRTEYKEFCAVSETALSIDAKKYMKVLATGVALETSDKKIIIQRRVVNLLAGGKQDCSAAGLVPVQAGRLNPRQAILEKLSRELRVDERSLEYLSMSGVFYCDQYQSTIVAFNAKTSKSFNAVSNAINHDYVQDVQGIRSEDVSDFVAENYRLENKLIGDGAGVLLLSLNRQKLLYTVKKIEKQGNPIFFKSCWRDD